MNKSRLIEILAARAHVRHLQAAQAVQAVFDRLATALVADDAIELRGLFSFRTKTYPKRSGRNPKTGEIIEVQAKRLPVLRVSKVLRTKLSCDCDL